MTQVISKGVRNSAAIAPPNFAPTQNMDHSLKGLLMDKGGDGLELKIRTILRNIELMQSAMEALVVQQRHSREVSGCDCMDLYLAKNLKTVGNVSADAIREMSLRDIQLYHLKGAASLEWRTRPLFSTVYGYRNTSRIYPFVRGSKQVEQVREFVDQFEPEYYRVLASYDAVKVTLNSAMRSLRKTLLDLHGLSMDVNYPSEIMRDVESLSKRFFKQLPDSSAIAQALNKLFC